MNAPVSFFASYSRRDKAYVEPVVDLLRTGAARVFVDQDNIQPGDRWEMVLEKNLESATTLLVFWSRNSKTSDWVQREWSDAAKAGKRIIPVLLDYTALPKELSAFQYIDFRHFRKHSPWLFVFGSIALLAIGWTAYLGVVTNGAVGSRDFNPMGESAPFWESHPWMVAGIASLLLSLLTFLAALVRNRTRSRQTREMAQNIVQMAKK